jgi:hypothetical protein
MKIKQGTQQKLFEKKNLRKGRLSNRLFLEKLEELLKNQQQTEAMSFYRLIFYIFHFVDE